MIVVFPGHTNLRFGLISVLGPDLAKTISYYAFSGPWKHPKPYQTWFPAYDLAHLPPHYPTSFPPRHAQPLKQTFEHLPKVPDFVHWPIYNHLKCFTYMHTCTHARTYTRMHIHLQTCLSSGKVPLI